MALSTKAKQKKLEKKKKNSKKRALKQKSVISRDNNEWKTHECLMYEDLFDGGKGHIIVSKVNRHGDLKVSFFLLDVFCVGIKDYFTAYMDIEEYHSTICRFNDGTGMHKQVEPSYACALIHKLYEYSKSLGITNPGVSKKISKVFNQIPQDKEQSFAFGSEGQPLYIPGPDDSQATVNKILKALDASVGAGNYEFYDNPVPKHGENCGCLESHLDQADIHLTKDELN